MIKMITAAEFGASYTRISTHAAITVVAGRTYYFSGYSKAPASDGDVHGFGIYDVQNTTDLYTKANAAGVTAWTQSTTTLTIPSGCTSVQIRLQGNDSGSKIGYYDSIVFKEIGVAAGWTTADAEPLIPQTALMGMSKPMVFDGIDDYVSMGDNFDVGTDDWTTVATFEINDKSTGGGDQIIVAKPYSDTDPNKFPGLILINGEITARVYDGSLFTADYDSTENNVRYQAVAVADRSGNMTLYINGASVATVDISSIDGNSWTVAKNYNVGTVHTADDDWFDGIVYSTSVFREALSLAQVQELFNDGIEFDLENNTLTGSPTLVGYWRNDGASTWTDRSANSNDGTVSDTSPATILLPEGTTAGKDILGFPLTHTNNGWLNLDGNEYVDAGDNDVFTFIDGGISLECWFKMDKTPVSNGYLIAKAAVDTAANGNNAEYQIIIDPNKDLTFRIQDDSDSAFIGQETNAALTVGRWYHVVCTHDVGGTTSATCKIYLGETDTPTSTVLVADIDSEANTYVAMENTTQPLTIGARSDASSFFVGSIDEVRVYNRVLSTEEITKNYNHGKSKHS
jgi:hypothetical protein